MKKPAYILLAVSIASTSSCGNDDNGTPLPAMSEMAKGEILNAYGFKQQDPKQNEC